MTPNAPEEFPSGWSRKPLEECALLITKGSTPTSYGHDYKDAGIRFVRVEHLENGHIEKEKIFQFIDEKANETLSRSRLQAGDILFSIAGTIGRTALVQQDDLPANTNQALAIIRGTELALNPSYLCHYLSSMTAQQQADSNKRGGAMNNISLADVKALSIPIPPIKEQTNIVQAIETHLTRLDAAVEALKRVQANLKRYRASVLKAAVEGRLVPTEAELARTEGRDYEPASELLKRIFAERRKRWEEDYVAKMNAKGKTPTDNKWKAKYKEPAPPDTTNLPTLPEGWAWATPHQLCSADDYALAIGPFGSNLKVSDYSSNGVPLIFVRNIRSENFDGADTKYISESKARELRAHKVSEGDVLVTKMGDPPGDACLYSAGSPEAIITADCVKISFHSFLTRPLFFVYAIRSPFVHRQILTITRGVAQKKINLQRFKNIVIPLPPISEQHRIVDDIERRFSIASGVYANMGADDSRAGKLRQSILKRAFDGKLVEQNPNDEPASVMLERIRAEREKAKDNRKQKPQRPRRKKKAASKAAG